jgi:hypothetical protein
MFLARFPLVVLCSLVFLAGCGDDETTECHPDAGTAPRLSRNIDKAAAKAAAQVPPEGRLQGVPLNVVPMGTTHYSVRGGALIYASFGNAKVARTISTITVYTDGHGTATVEAVRGGQLRVYVPGLGSFTGRAYPIRSGVRFKGSGKEVEFVWSAGKLQLDWSGFGTLIDGASAELTPR